MPRRQTKKAKTSKKIHPRHERQRAWVWAALSLTAFFVAFTSSILNGAWGAMPFFFGSIGLFSVMFIEALVRGKIWIFEEDFSKIFGDRDIGMRLIFFSAASLLMFETALFLLVLAPQL